MYFSVGTYILPLTAFIVNDFAIYPEAQLLLSSQLGFSLVSISAFSFSSLFRE